MTFDPLEWIDDALTDLADQHLLREPTMRGGPQSGSIVVNGRRYINFGSNDYLSLASDPRLLDAARACLQKAGWGSGASPLVTGRSTAQAELERHLAAFEETEAAIVFPSGFAANVGTLTSLAGRGDQIFSDAKNHASLIDGCRLSAAAIRIYPHRDTRALQRLLAEQPVDPGGRRVIVTDSVFSMDGDLAPLPELVEIAQAARAILVVDEAHATGVLGAHGRGACELMGVETEVPVRIGTFSKALGSIGGFVAGRRSLIQWLYNRARPQVFSTALPAACHAAALAAVKIVRDEPNRRDALLDSARHVRDRLSSQGWHVIDGVTPIIAVRIGDPAATMQFAERLRDQQLWVPGIRPPSVPVGESLLRISLTYHHTRQHLDQLIEAFEQLPVVRS